MPEASKHLTIITPITLVFPSVSGVVWFYRIQIERIALSVYLGSGLSVMKTNQNSFANCNFSIFQMFHNCFGCRLYNFSWILRANASWYLSTTVKRQVNFASSMRKSISHWRSRAHETRTHTFTPADPRLRKQTHKFCISLKLRRYFHKSYFVTSPKQFPFLKTLLAGFGGFLEPFLSVFVGGFSVRFLVMV